MQPVGLTLACLRCMDLTGDAPEGAAVAGKPPVAPGA